MSVSAARRAVLDVLGRVRSRQAFGTDSLDAVLAAQRLDRKDTAFATRLAYGVLQTSGTLDEVIDRACDRPERLEPRVRDTLRMGAYELLFMRTPARAAVNEAVEAAKAHRMQSAGLVNAVMRRVAAEAGDFPWGDAATDDEALARASAHPSWLCRMWIRELGRDVASAVMEADNTPAPLNLWHNPFSGSLSDAVSALDWDGAAPVEGTVPGCITAGEPHGAVTGRALADGRVVVTDEAAQLAARAVGAHPGGVVVDLACGRGTKTAELQALSAAAGAPARVYAIDLHPFKTRLVEERMRSLGVPAVTAIAGDITDVGAIDGLPAAGTVDAALLDAPCSGLGTLRRRAEKRWRVTDADIDRLAGLQLHMLAEASSLVRPGGLVVYSTCTVSSRENAGVVGAFLESDRGAAFSVKDLSDMVPAAWSDRLDVRGVFQSVTTIGGPDGHFVCALTRSE